MFLKLKNCGYHIFIIWHYRKPITSPLNLFFNAWQAVLLLDKICDILQIYMCRMKVMTRSCHFYNNVEGEFGCGNKALFFGEGSIC